MPLNSKISNLLPEPEFCDNCCSSNIGCAEEIGSSSLFIWYCADCRSQVNCHRGTRIPMGKMADAETRQLRKQCHSVFDPLWKSGLFSREKAYYWLAVQLKIHSNDCHIGELTKFQLTEAINLSKALYEEREKHIFKRMRKAQIKKSKQANKTRRKIDNRKKHYQSRNTGNIEATLQPYPRGYR